MHLFGTAPEKSETYQLSDIWKGAPKIALNRKAIK